MKLRNLKTLLGLSPKVVVRIAPSPTGALHIGTARTALFNYLYARRHGGTFILRIEDTDRKRSRKEFEEDILSGLSWLGLAHDVFARQSDRTERYRHHLEELLKSGHAYRSAEPKEGEPGVIVEVIRLRNPGSRVSFTDLIRGPITFDTGELGDFVIARSLREPLYHFAAVADDYDMGVTHVIRGEDHISNTPRQILIQEALQAPRPHYAHIPLILAPDRSKLSKRSGTTALSEYRKEGYLPEALLNYLALLGWNPGTNQEIFTLEELVKTFDLEHVQKGGAVFDIEKLAWFNKAHLRRLSDDEFVAALEPFVPKRLKTLRGFSPLVLKKLSGIIRERIATLGEFTALAEVGEFDCFFEAPHPTTALLVPKGKEREETSRHLESVAAMLAALDDSRFDAETVKAAVFPYATEKGRGAVLSPMRIALSGRERSPDPFTIASSIGKAETIRRLQSASATLKG